MTFVSVCSQPSWVDNTVQPQGLLGNHRLSPSFPVCDLSHIELRMNPTVFMSYWTTGLWLIEINHNHIIKIRLSVDVYCSPRFLCKKKKKRQPPHYTHVCLFHSFRSTCQAKMPFFVLKPTSDSFKLLSDAVKPNLQWKECSERSCPPAARCSVCRDCFDAFLHQH